MTQSLTIPSTPGAKSPSAPHSQQRGSNQMGIRAYNERLILTLVRQEPGLPKAEIARRTGLSAQTVSVIMRALEADDLLIRGEPVRGRIGQPSIPMAINPQGAYFFGLHVGRRRSEFMLLDFCGAQVHLWDEEYPYPEPASVIAFVEACLRETSHYRAGPVLDRIAGLGIALPSQLWNWANRAGASAKTLSAWKSIDLRHELALRLPYPVYIQNDATAACSAELAFGSATSTLQDFVYLFVDTFVGGGIVLDRQVISGRAGNAGALGSLLVPDCKGRVRQLIDIASLSLLEEEIRQRGQNSNIIWRSPDDWGELEDLSEDWITASANGLAYAIVNASAVFDFDAAVIDGLLPDRIRTRLIERVRVELGTICSEGLTLPRVLPGTIGSNARVLGGASLPLSKRFLLDYGALRIA